MYKIFSINIFCLLMKQSWIILLKNLATALECYVCANQSDNAGKCLNTIKTCEPDEDVCKTEIRWGKEEKYEFWVWIV